MAIEIDLINSKVSKKGQYKKLPKTGLSVNWGGKIICVTVDNRSISLGYDKAPKSKLNRISSLPRISGELDYAGKRLTLKTASLIEALSNLKTKKVKSFSKAVETQLNEIALPQTQMDRLGKKAPVKEETLEAQA
ncbi:MAG: hypothetical protein HOO06_08080 [Bdellovibrionaceae bacterium]|jgi:hypothetical protein|nr:hypothetical protein [Pseudobdellovibrionaceae bacterium]